MVLQRLQLYTIKREDKQVLNVVISWYFFDLHICTRFQDNEMYHDIVWHHSPLYNFKMF